MNRKFINTAVALLFVCAHSSFAQQLNSKVERLTARADRNFQNYSYQKAIAQYKGVLKLDSNAQVKLPLANSYRLLNDAENSVDWYEKAAEESQLSPDDMLHYGQVLSTSGQYKKAAEVLEAHQNHEDWVDEKLAGLKDIKRFFRNEEAFVISKSHFNSKYREFSPVYAGEDIVFVTDRPSAGLFKPEYRWDGSNFLDLFYLPEGGKPEKIHRGINTRFHEGPAFIFGEGKKMIFTRNNYHRKKARKSSEGINMLKLFYSEQKENGKWKKPRELSFNSDEYNTAHPTGTAKGNILYFSSDRPGGYGGADIYVSRWKRGKWSEPKNVGPHINTERDEVFPFLHNDSTLYLSSDGREGLGGLDLFRVSVNKSFKPRNLGYPANTKDDDFGIVLKAGTSSGYFSSNRSGGIGSDDIYEVFIYDYIVTVKLVDAESKKELTGQLEAYELILNNEELVGETSTGTHVVFPALKGADFMIQGSAEGYLADSLKVETGSLDQDAILVSFTLLLAKKSKGDVEILVIRNNDKDSQVAVKFDTTFIEYKTEINSLLDSLQKANHRIARKTVLQNIYFDLDKHTLRPDARKELDRLISVLKTNRKLRVKFSAHTDLRGRSTYNDQLSERRAKAASNYLLSKGIDETRIQTVSFGEEQAFVECEDCHEGEHQLNRRVEIELLFESGSD